MIEQIGWQTLLFVSSELNSVFDTQFKWIFTRFDFGPYSLFNIIIFAYAIDTDWTRWKEEIRFKTDGHETYLISIHILNQ